MLKSVSIRIVLVSLLFVAPARAATVTLLFSPNANASGDVVVGSYAVWAWTSAGDNAGLAAFTYTLTGQATTQNRSPRAVFAPSDPDSTDNFLSSGFTLLRSTGNSGVATTGAFDTVSGQGVVQYGVGQTAGDLVDALPAGYDLIPASSVPTVYGRVTASAGGTLANIAYFTGGQRPVLLGSGTLSSGMLPTFSLGAANVFSADRSGRVEAAQVVMLTGGFTSVPEPVSLAGLAFTAGLLLTRRRIISIV